MTKKTMTLNLTAAEMQALNALCKAKGMNKTAVMRQALRLYQAVEVRSQRGHRLVFEGGPSKSKEELIVL
jgi:hypothetical protein